ncbi:hypothetical protein TIFTF001_030985 [Ficus carica]|uniref:Retrotransposon gag domain-containing protein n=1 Tax=Ficus carica TaxID=3494 RepID=A0AA88J0F5_FICCA|nr:hypothetical protein TIFTF001_030985 [Ficus carica]
MNIQGSTTSVFYRLGRPGDHRRIVQECSVDKPAKEEDNNQNRLDQLQRFKMPSMASYDGSTDADEHVENYKASPWIDRLLQATGGLLCGCLPKFKDQEARSVPLVQHQQGGFETLEKYLERFDKAVVQVESCTDDTLMQAFREGIKYPRLVWTLAYDRPPTFAHLRGIAWRNHPDHSRPDKGKAVDVGHDTKDCIQLRDQIELLIRDGHLREFMEIIITPVGPSGIAAPAARQNPGPCNRTNEPEQEHIVHTIFGGTATGDTASSQRSYTREARRTPITFTDDEADRLLHSHNDALIGEIRVADNVVRRVLIDNGSSADIMFMDAFSGLKIEGAVLTPTQTLLYGLAVECVRAAGTVSLSVTIGDGTERVTRMVEFIVVDRSSVYNVILGKPTLNALKAVVSTYHLAMKFPAGGGVGVFRGN